MSDAIDRKVIGQRVRRLEDRTLLKGEARFVADITLPGMLHVAFIRSPYAHAMIESIDTANALSLPGVVAVFTAKEIAQGLTRLRMPLGFPTDALPKDITPYVLSPKEVCFVGEPVAMVVAHSRREAEDGAGAVDIVYEPLPVSADFRRAIEPDAPKVRTEVTDNVLTRFRINYGDCAAARQTAAREFHTELHQHRGGAHPMEGRGIIASFDDATGDFNVWASTQMAHDLKFTIADMLGLPESRIRVLAPSVGGGFGAKFMVYPEDIAVAAAAYLMKQPLKWIEDRQEHFVSAIQERDQYWDMTIAVDADARILAISGKMIHDQGAYTPQGINCPYNAATSVTGPYIVPNYDVEVVVAQTNKVYTIPVRGAGYPEAVFVMERLLDLVADELGMDRAEVRRRNLIPPSKMPYTKPLKARSNAPIVLDTGDYLAAQAEVLERIGYEDFPRRQAEALRQGRYIGIGLGQGVKGTGRGPFESGAVAVSSTGRILVTTGAMHMGQGLGTALAQICAETLGVAVEKVEVISGDTSKISLGIGGFASRQTVTAGSSVLLAAERVREKALLVASQLLAQPVEQLLLKDGYVEKRDAPETRISLADIARKLRGVPGYSMPPGVDAGLEATCHWQIDSLSYANSCHACEVEVDIVTGGITLTRYVALQDSGRLINPTMVEGQLHGGIVHGIGNAMFEFMNYDDEGQPLSTTFADYLLATAPEIPRIELILHESPAPSNPLGVKGVGEGGTIPVAAAIASAVESALKPFQVRIQRVPISPVHLMEQIAASEEAARVLQGAGAEPQITEKV
jgi:carbon-monoxide dehydrogenase large subunit